MNYTAAVIIISFAVFAMMYMIIDNEIHKKKDK